MALIALRTGFTAGLIRPSHVPDPLQRTRPAAVDLPALSVVKLNASGQWALADSTSAPIDTWLVVLPVKAGMPATGFKSTMVEGLNLDAYAFGARAGLSATAGRIDDAPAAGKACGMVVPADGYALAGNTPDKLLMWNSAQSGI